MLGLVDAKHEHYKLTGSGPSSLQPRATFSTQILGQNLDTAFSEISCKRVPVGDENKALIERVLESMAEQYALGCDHARLPPVHLQQTRQATSARARVQTSQLGFTIHEYAENVPTWMLLLTWRLWKNRDREVARVSTKPGREWTKMENLPSLSP